MPKVSISDVVSLQAASMMLLWMDFHIGNDLVIGMSGLEVDISSGGAGGELVHRSELDENAALLEESGKSFP